MPCFDVYATPFADERQHTPYWLDVQSDHLSLLETRVVVPLRRLSPDSRLAPDLNPGFELAGVSVYADVANIGAYPRALLRQPVANLRHERMAIEDALDFLFTGF